MVTNLEGTRGNVEESSEKVEYKNYATDPVLATHAKEFVKDLHSTLKRKRKPFEAMWAECNDAFRCIESKTWFTGAGPYCASDLRDATLNIVSKITKAVWYTDIPFDLVPVGHEGDDEKLAEINQKVLEWDFRNLRIFQKYLDAEYQKAIFGTTVVKTPPSFEMITRNLRRWHEERSAGFKTGKKHLWKKETERMFMGTDFIPVDIMDFWIDPATVGNGFRDPVEFSDTIESVCVKGTDLRLGKQNGIYVNIDKIEADYIGSKKATEESANKQRMKRAGHMTQDGALAGKTWKDRGNKMYELKEVQCEFDLGTGEPEPCLITLGADKEVIRIQKWEGEKPYLSSRYQPNGYNKEFYGTGVIETSLSNHYERNATRKQIVAARTIGLNMEIFSDSTGLQNKPDKLKSAANKIHWVRNINGVKPFEKPIGQILNSAVAHETNLKAEMQTTTGNTPYIQGQGTSSINDTAAGIQMLTAAGNEKFFIPLQLSETTLLEPFVKRSLQNNIDYRKEAFYIRLTDQKPIRVEPEDLSANFDVYSKGSSELQNKNERTQGMLKAWQFTLDEIKVSQQTSTNVNELKKELFANLGITQPDRFINDPQAQQQTGLPPEAEWVLIKRMADGSIPTNPILIQPGEDYRKHYEEHIAQTATEEYDALPPQYQYIWNVHIMSYDKVMKVLDAKKYEADKEIEVQNKEVAVPQ
jgi:hypothetical protein